MSVVVTIAEAKIYTDHGWAAETRGDIDRTCHDDRPRIDNNRRRRNIDRSRCHHGCNRDNGRRGHRVDGSRSINRRAHINRWRVKCVGEDMDGGDTGENLANRGPFPIAGGCGLHAGGGYRGET